jgi:RNA polymerase sigma-70 factor (ECF subfamily)
MTKEIGLIRAAQQGDMQAFNDLVMQYYGKICRVTTRYVHDPQDALDIAQETFMRAHKALACFHLQSSFYTWVYRIAINVAKNHVSSAKRQEKCYVIPVQTVHDALTHHDSPEQELLRDELQEKIEQVLDQLPTNLKMVIILREVEGLSYLAMAEKLACSLGTIRSRLFRARAIIDNRL